jgi:hypothetical protein
MPKFAPKIVKVTGALKGAEGEGLGTAVFVLEMDVMTGAEY